MACRGKDTQAQFLVEVETPNPALILDIRGNAGSNGGKRSGNYAFSEIVLRPLVLPDGTASARAVFPARDRRAPDSANSSGSPIFGEAWVRPSRPISGSSNRSPCSAYGEANYIWGIHLFIMPTDSLGNPDVSHMLLDGPTLVHADGDGIHPTPFEFVFDPPFQLPKPGLYDFAVQSDPCEGIWDILDTNVDHYPQGCLWLHGHSINPGCPLRINPGRYSDADLASEFVSATRPRPSRRRAGVRSNRSIGRRTPEDASTRWLERRPTPSPCSTWPRGDAPRSRWSTPPARAGRRW